MKVIAFVVLASEIKKILARVGLPEWTNNGEMGNLQTDTAT
jgi:hypothetical protein